MYGEELQRLLKNRFFNMKKGFTLIELLIVVAIIGILAGVGIPMYNGYIVTTKINASNANHSNIKTFVAAALAKCASGSSEVELPGYYLPMTCSQTAHQNMGYVVGYLNYNAQIKNPYNADSGCDPGNPPDPRFCRYGVYYWNNWNPPIGSSALSVIGNSNTINIITNIGDKSGGNVYLRETFLKE